MPTVGHGSHHRHGRDGGRLRPDVGTADVQHDALLTTPTPPRGVTLVALISLYCLNLFIPPPFPLSLSLKLLLRRKRTVTSVTKLCLPVNFNGFGR